MEDLDGREVVSVVPLLALTVLIGVARSWFST